jgi:uncharacterized protein
MAHPGRLRNHDPIADEIRRAIRNEDENRAVALIESSETDVLDGNARTPLIWAATFNRQRLVRWLIDRGAFIDHQDRIGYSALHFVAQEKHVEIATCLLNAKASIELRDIHGNTPLWTAIFSAGADLRVVSLLFEHGANLDNKNNAGMTIRELAKARIPHALIQRNIPMM